MTIQVQPRSVSWKPSLGLFLLLACSLLLIAGCGNGSEPQATASPGGGDTDEVSQEEAIERVLANLALNPENQPDASTAIATRMTEREALETMQRRGGIEARPPTPLSDEPVWLVEVRGQFVGFRPEPARQGTWFQVVPIGDTSPFGGFVPDEQP